MATLEISPSVPVPNAIEVFCSYSHKDDHLREELETHLSILQAHGIIDSWHDHAIPAGKEWASQIDERLNSAQIILLLISPDFLASKYCREVEVKRALERHNAGEARVISILLRDVDWHGSPLSKLQALPKDAKPITTWANRDQAFKDVAIGIRKVAEELRKKRIPTKASASVALGGRIEAAASVPEVPAPGKPGREPVTKGGRSLPGKYLAIGMVAAILLAGLAYVGAGKLGWKGQRKRQFQAGEVGAFANGQVRYYGGIDLGAKGTKPDLFSLNSGKKLDGLKLETIETELFSSMREGQFSDRGIREATNAVSRLLGQMQTLAKKNQIPVQYFVVGSSSVAKAKNRDALAASVKAATGIDMDFIDAKREGYFGLLSTIPSIPKDKLNVSSYLDIGSGNTKFGCLVGGGLDLADYRGGDIDYGSVSARNKGAEKNQNTLAGIDEVMVAEVAPAYTPKSKDVPCLRNASLIYWTGGAAWATVTFMHPEQSLEPTVKISRADLVTFLAMLRDRNWNPLKPLQYPFPKDMPVAKQRLVRDRAERDRAKLTSESFVAEDMYAGVSIMKTILGSSNPSAVVTFVRDGGKFLHGFAAEKYHDPAGESEPARP